MERDIGMIKNEINWIKLFREALFKCIKKIEENLYTQEGQHITSIKPDGDPSLQTEIACENIVKDLLLELNIPIIFYSEEQKYILNNKESKYIVLFDPIDGTFFAKRRLAGGCIAISVHHYLTLKPIASMVMDILTKDLYFANNDGAYLNGKKIRVSDTTNIEKAYISTCYGKKSRFSKISNNVVKNAEWFETTGTMLSMVKVATGQIDAYFDFMKGYKSYEFIPASFIAIKAGAIFADENGDPFVFPEDLDKRNKFIIASTSNLVDDIVNAYRGTNQ